MIGYTSSYLLLPQLLPSIPPLPYPHLTLLHLIF